MVFVVYNSRRRTTWDFSSEREVLCSSFFCSSQRSVFDRGLLSSGPQIEEISNEKKSFAHLSIV